MKSPNRSSVQSGDSSFLFKVAKRPPGYLLSNVSLLSSHLLMRWLTTPAATAIKKEIMTSMKTPPPVARCR